MRGKYTVIITTVITGVLFFAGCGTAGQGLPADPAAPETVAEDADRSTPDTIDGEEDNEAGDTEGLGDTLITDDITSAGSGPTQTQQPSDLIKDVDLIFFMGQSNMSGAAGDASLAPAVSADAGEEFRAVSDPTKLYPIKEPFGINENDPQGLNEYPGAKKGSLVSAFVNEYHKLTGRKVIAVSASMGATEIGRWTGPGISADVKLRYDRAVTYLKDNGYNIGHIYVVWLHGESDALFGTDPEVYRTDLDNIMRPLFIDGLQKVFIILPGRTIDYRDIFLPIIDVEKKICKESGYYALATTVLTKVSTEYMVDQYHYNQHVLNLTGTEAAKAVAYYTRNGVEKIVYDYREGEEFVPDGVDEDSQPEEAPLDLSAIDINRQY